jgi:hypothetical protein
LLVQATERLGHRWLLAERTHQGMAGVSLLDLPGQLAGPVPQRGEVGFRAARDQRRHRDGQRDGDQRHHGQQG